MGALESLLSSRVKAGIFRVLFGLKDAELHVRELARQTGFNEATVRQELRKLRRLELVSGRRVGNRFYCRANREHPLYPEIHGLVLKTSGLVDVLKNALNGAAIDIAFVFGSVAKGEATAQSDVDLMVLGDIGLRKLAGLLSGIAVELGREINPHVMKRTEYRKRYQGKDHFVSRVLDGPKLFIIGCEDDLKTMAS